MKLPKLTAFGLVGASLLITTQVGCGTQGPSKRPLVSNPHRLVTISVNVDDNSKCEVDYPVALLRKSKKHDITWGSEDHDYWIKFDSGGSPFDPSNTAIKVPGNSTAGPYGISSTAAYNYYKYAIYFANPDGNPQAAVCKTADDDHDTGVNVKR